MESPGWQRRIEGVLGMAVWLSERCRRFFGPIFFYTGRALCAKMVFFTPGTSAHPCATQFGPTWFSYTPLFF
jgi:hypothetical protein